MLLVLCCLITSCSTTKKVPNETINQKNIDILNEKDGLSYENAIVINEKSESSGVDAEYAWVRQNYPGYETKGQSLKIHKKKAYDIITIVNVDGKEMTLYFDISSFYGKLESVSTRKR